MAVGDVIIFDKAVKPLLDNTHDLDTDEFKLAICDNTLTPTKAMLTPALSDFTQVGVAGTYVLDGQILAVTLTELNEITKLDFTTNPTWLLNALNDIDAFWGIVYNNTNVGKEAIAFVDLGGPFDMQTDDLIVSWHPDGVLDMINL